MEASAIEVNNRKNALYNGLALGAALFVLGTIVYYILIGTTSVWVITLVPTVISVIIPILLAVFMSLDLRRKMGGYWTFKQATTGIFIMFIVAYAFNTIARDLIFAKLIEPDMIKKTEAAVINSTQAMMEKSGVDQATIDRRTADAQKQFDEQQHLSAGKILSGIGVTIVLLFVVALLFGAMFKKDPPLFTVTDTESEDANG
jgi:hypothetical protein